MIKLIDGKNEVILDSDDMDNLFGAMEDLAEEYGEDSGYRKTLDRLREVYHIEGSDS